MLKLSAVKHTTAEFKTVLEYEKFAKRLGTLNTTVEEVFAYFMNLIHHVPTPKNIPNIINEDPFYNIFLALALQHNAHLIISGDNHLLGKKEYRNIQIVTPGEACHIIEKVLGL